MSTGTKLTRAEFESRWVEIIGKKWYANPSVLLAYIASGKATKAGMKVFALEHCYFADRFPRWFGPIVGNCPHLHARQYLIGNMFVEEVEDPLIKNSHYESLVDFAVGLGATREEVYEYRPSLEMRMLGHYFDNIARTKPWVVAFAGVGGTECVNSGKLAKSYGMRPINSREYFANLGVTGKELEHWEAGEAADQGDDGHGEESLNLIYKYASSLEEQLACLEQIAESVEVLHFVHDEVGRRAKEADRRAA